MAKPEPVYDKGFKEEDEQPVTRPDLQALEGGGETTEPKRGHLHSVGDKDKSKTESPEDLEQAEGGGFYKPDKAEAEEQGKLAQTDNQIGEGFREGEASGLKKITGRFSGMSRRKKIITGSIVGVLVGGSFGLFSILQGPFQLMQLGQVLGKFSNRTQTSISTRLQKHFKYVRYQKTGDIGETRVGYLGSKRFAEIETRLKEIGIEFNRDPNTGRPLSQTFDTSLNNKYKGLSPEQAKIAIANDLGVPKEAVHQISGLNDGEYAINWAEVSDTKARYLANSTVELLQDGKIPAGMNKRVMKKFFNLPALFTPLEKLTASTQNKLSIRLNAKTREERLAAEAERYQSNVTPTLSTKYRAAVERVNEKIKGYKRAINATLLGFTGLCVVRSIAKAVPLVNYAQVVVPAMVQATDKQAVGSQTQSNDVPSINMLGNVVESLKDDDGKTVWEGKALNALATNSGGEGAEIDPDYRQTFSNATTSNSILSVLDVIGNNAISDAACSTPGQILLGAIDIGLLVLGPGGWAAKAAQSSVSTAATSSAIHFLEGEAIDKLSVDPIKFFSGPQGGNLLAFGARASANLVALSMGGMELSDSEEQIFFKQQEQIEKEQFQQRGFFARIFNLNDRRSLASNVLQKTEFSPKGSLSNFATSMLSAGNNSISRVLSATIPKVHAADEPYDWSFPLYGIPDAIMNDQKYEDPYENAGKVVQLFKGTSGSTYIDRARNCFGVNIAKGAEGWDALPSDPVNPVEDSYIDANCNDMGDENWVRTMLFVFDSTIARDVDCYSGGEESCSQMGFGFGGITQTTTTAPSQSGLESPPNLGPEIANGYYLMPDPPADEYIFSPGTPLADRCGSKMLVDVIYTVSKRWYAKYPQSKIRVGDLNAAVGHASHKNGVDVDITTIDQSAANTSGNAEKSKELAHMFADTGVIKLILYNDTAVQNDFNGYASSKGLPAVMESYPGHDGHFHVRILDEFRLGTSLGCPG